jgi:4'-phosphopantetheinyl transferase
VDAASRLGLGPVRVHATCADCGGDHGRPEVETTDGRVLGASVSHTDTATFAAVSRGIVGIDAEPLLGAPDRFVAIREVTGRDEDAAPDGDGALRVWTAVEAVLKADGRGLAVDPRTVSLSPWERLRDGTPGWWTTTARIAHAADAYTVSATTVDGIVLSIAVPGTFD